MNYARRLPAALSVGAAAAALLTAGPAFAQSASPPPAATAKFCPTELQDGQVIQEPDGSLQFCVEAQGAGAVVVRTGVFLDYVIVAPGWEWSFGGGSNTSGKVDVRFENPATDGRVEVRLEPGKTEVKAG